MQRKLFLFFLIAVLFVIALPVASGQDSAETFPYQDASLDVEARVADLLSRMTLEEKIGQMTLMEKNSITAEGVTEYFIGGVLSGGGGYPAGNNTPEGWMDMVHGFQDAALSTRLAIPMIYGVDAVHGHSNLEGAVIFPHNIGLGATRNAELVEEIGRVTALEMIATGIYWDYSPVLAVPRDIRWGRTYEGYGENTELVTEMAMAMLNGLQGESLSAPTTVLATPKHYVGDGGTAFGTSPFDDGFLDRGVTDVDEETLRAVHLPPYIAAIENGARSIMVSYSSWGGLRMHGQDYLINDVLRDELGFEGFIVSDWAGIDDVAPDYYDAIVGGINAGVDMNMVPYDHVRFINTMLEAVENGDIPMERIDEAVSNILRVKFELGLFEQPYGDESLIDLVGSDEHRALAREAVSQSLVLLKNENEALPLAADTEQTVLIAGMAADDMGVQSGGWTIEWQGISGDISGGTSILTALEAVLGTGDNVRYDRFGRLDEGVEKVDLGIVVVGETPYAEWFGDTDTLTLSEPDKGLIERMRGNAEKLVVIVLSGRPLAMENEINLADAVVAAWLPGTEGAGVTDVLFGEKPFTGTLSYTWPRSVEQLPFDFANLPGIDAGCAAPQFPYGYGLTYENSESEWVDLALECTPIVIEEVVEQASDLPAPTGKALAPEGTTGETYYAPFPVEIVLDGAFDEWENIPLVQLGAGVGRPAVNFAAAADAENLYLYADVIDPNIISGEHGGDYWNEDSIEFYINATGEPALTSYTDGVAQLTIPPLNIGLPPEEAILAGVRGDTTQARVVTVATENGWAVEVAMPLVNDVWSIPAENGQEIGFQVHLNAASELNRDTKLIWSIFDTSDVSYQNPSVFGTLIFYRVADQPAAGVSAEYVFNSTLAEDGTVDDFENGIWLDVDASANPIGLVPDGTALSIRQITPDADIALPDQSDADDNVLAIAGSGTFTHAFTDGTSAITQDWTAYNAIGMWLYSAGNSAVSATIHSQGTAASAALDADLSGWQHVIIPFNLFTTDGDTLDWSAVSGYGLSTTEGAEVLYIDDVRLFNVENTSQMRTGEAVPQGSFILDDTISWDSREWELIWADEFDGATSTPINDENWTCEVGGDGWGNNELEYYTQSLENASQNGEGQLVITAMQGQPESGETCWYGQCAFTSARCITRDKFEFTYGRVEARLQIPRGQGIWPAFWMLGANYLETPWPDSGEIDIMENIGSEPQTVHGTVHGPGYSGASGIGNSYSMDADFADDYHVYAVDWDPNVIRWYVDGELYGTVSVDDLGNREWVFDHDFFIILNIAVGGAWPGFPDESTEFPQTMSVDYVRVYQLAD